MNQEFQVHILNEEGITHAREVAEDFDFLLEKLKVYIPESRAFSIVKTKLEEACFFAKKAIACNPSYQK